MTMNEEIQAQIHPIWKTNPGLVIASLIFLASMVFLVGVTVYVVLDREFEGDVIGAYESPRSVLNSVPGYNVPAIEERGALNVIGYRCIRGKKDIDVRMQITFTDLERGLNIPYLMRDKEDGREGRVVEQRRDHGCLDQQLQFILPERVTPGIWHVEAVEVANISGELINWFSEPFTVVPIQ